MIVIKGVASYLPNEILTNQMLVNDFPGWSEDKIFNKLGIKKRHISKNETISGMAIAASKKLFEKCKINPSDIDFILLCTQSPDFILPTTACLVQEALGIPTSSGAIDFNQGCSGFVYGLAIAKGLISANIAQNIILITSEAYTKHLNINDTSNRSIFGDGATATWVCNSQNGFSIHDFILGTDGKGAPHLIVKNGGSRNPKKMQNNNSDDDNTEKSNDHLYMNGTEVFNFTLNSIPKLISNTLQKNRLEINDIDYFVFHQANKFMLEHLRKKIGIDEEKFIIQMENTGNTVSSSIPLILENLFDCLDGKNTCKIFLAGFGVGFSWGGVVLSKT